MNDPTKILVEIREKVAKLRKMEGTEDVRTLKFSDLALNLADDVADLDEWISGGGALPNHWGEAKPRKCPRCQREFLHPSPARNALSRVAKIYICSRCGNDEAIRDIMGEHPWPNHPDPVPL